MIVKAVKIKVLRSHIRDGVMLLKNSEILVSPEEANILISRGMAVEVCLIYNEE